MQTQVFVQQRCENYKSHKPQFKTDERWVSTHSFIHLIIISVFQLKRGVLLRILNKLVV